MMKTRDGTEPAVRRITVDLEAEEYETLQNLREVTGRTAASLMRSGLQLVKLFYEERRVGNKIIIEGKVRSKEIIVQF